ncbi:MAG: site-2 protease family protein [Planctomycetia bacterium]|nr:site-2 protease family protein [Planctomycetia bacterium]
MFNTILFAALDLQFWWVVLQCAIALGLIIFVHELGHFLVAKACGVRCDKFYIGFDFFGLKLCKFKWGETEYGIGIFPLGGYVKMLGQEDNPGELKERLAKAKAAREALENDANAKIDPNSMMTDEQILEAENTINDPRSYQSKSVPQRLAIIVAGVTMNVIFAFVVAFAAYLIGVNKSPCTISNTMPGMAAWEAGLETGDTILAINGNELRYSEEVQKNVTLGSQLDKGIAITYRREGVQANQGTLAFPRKVALAPMLGVTQPCSNLVLVDGAFPASAAFNAEKKSGKKLEKGDTIVAINGVEVRSFREFKRNTYAHWGEPVVLTIARASGSAQREREKALLKLTPNDVLLYEEIQTKYLEGAERFDFALQTNKLKHFGIVFEMGEIQATRNGINGPTPAREAGLKAGDKLLAMEINGQMESVGDPMTLPYRIHQIAKTQDSIKFKVWIAPTAEDKENTQGREEVIELSLLKDETPVDSFMVGGGIAIPELGLAYYPSETVAAVVPGSEAEKAGVVPGAKLVSIQMLYNPPEKENPTEEEKKLREIFPEKDSAVAMNPDVAKLAMLFFENIQLYPIEGTQVYVVLDMPKKEGASVSMRLEASLPLAEYDDVYASKFGLGFEPQTIFIRGSIMDAVVLGAEETWNSLTMVFQMLEKLFSGQVSVKGLGGPILIAQAAYKYAQHGLSALLIFTCLISANLAVVNLLPIPILDGGHVVFLLYEGITGRAPNENLVVILSYLGLLFFLVLTIFVFCLDLGFISRL